MKRAELDAMTLEELYRLAEDRGIREAPGLPREVLVARLASDRPPAPTHHHAAQGRGESAREHSRERDLEDQHRSEAQRRGPRASSESGPLSTPPGSVPASSSVTPPSGTRQSRRHPAGIPSGVQPDRPQGHDTESMARLYLEQGDADRAAELYRELLRLRPDDTMLVAGLATAERLLGIAPAPAAPATGAPPPGHPAAPAPGEPLGMLDLEEPPDAYGIDDCELLFKDPHSLFIYWEVTDGGLAAARRHLGEEAQAARLVVRIFSHLERDARGDRGPERESRDHALDWNHGRRYFPSPRPGAKVRAAVGLVTPSGLFAPIAHSSQMRVPPAEPSAHVSTEWMEVTPARTRGLEREPIGAPQRGEPTGERIINGDREVGGGGGPGGPGAPRGGSSERSIPGAPGGSSSPGGPTGSSPSSPWRWRPGSGN